MNKSIKIIKILSAILFILIVSGVVMVKFYPLSVVDFFVKVNPQYITKLYPDCIASIDEVYFKDIVITENSVSMNVENFSSILSVKRIEFKEVDNILYVYVYKGFATKGDDFVETICYEMNMTNINKIIHVDDKGEEREIWKR